MRHSPHNFRTSDGYLLKPVEFDGQLVFTNGDLVFMAGPDGHPVDHLSGEPLDGEFIDPSPANARLSEPG